jgi:prefoldin subunit 5
MIDDFEVPSDPGYGFDDYGPGKCLSLSLLSWAKELGCRFFFPTVPAADETGERRGACLVARQEASTFATLTDWREASSHDWQAARSQGKANLPEGEHNAGCKTTEKEDSKTELFVHLNVERQTIEANWQAKDETIARLSAEIGAIDADRRAKDEVIARVNRELEAVDADRKAKDEVITRLSRELEAVNRELEAVNEDRRAKDEVIAALDKELAAVEARSVLSHMAIKVRRRWTER